MKNNVRDSKMHCGMDVEVKTKRKKMMKQTERELQGGEGGITKGVCLCHYRVEAVGCPSARKTPPRVRPYISAI